MEEEKTTNKSQKKELQKQLGYFSVFKYLPVIVAVVLFILSFIWGIVDPIIFGRGSHLGVMELPNGFLCWLVWVVIGAVIAVCTYFLMRIACSHKLLQIYYLQKLANEEAPILKDTL